MQLKFARREEAHRLERLLRVVAKAMFEAGAEAYDLPEKISKHAHSVEDQKGVLVTTWGSFDAMRACAKFFDAAWAEENEQSVAHHLVWTKETIEEAKRLEAMRTLHEEERRLGLK